MPRPAITTFSSVAVKPTTTNKNNGLYAPELTTAQRDAIPAATLRNGAIIYNITDDQLQSYIRGAWVDTGEGGDVVGPAVAVDGNIAIFDGITGKLIQDSGVAINRVGPLLLQNPFNLLSAPNLLVNEITDLGHIRFTNGTGFIFLESDVSIAFLLNTFGDNPEDVQACSVFTGGLPPDSSTSPTALVELLSTTGALLLSRLTQVQIDELRFPAAGMILFNTDINRLSFYNGTSWLDTASGNLITLGGAVQGTGEGSIDTTLNPLITCTTSQQSFTSAITGPFNFNIQNLTDFETAIAITTGGFSRLILKYDPIAFLNSIDCQGNPFALSSLGTIQFYKGETGNIGIGTSTPHAQLQLASTEANRKIVLYEFVNNDQGFFGFGINANILRYQVPATYTDHVFYAAASSSTSNELARITGLGDVVVAGNIYGRRPSGVIYSAAGNPSITPTANTWIKIAGTTVAGLGLNLFSATNNRLQYTGPISRPVTVHINLNITISPVSAAATDYGFSIFKGGIMVTGSDLRISTNSTNYYTLSTSAFTTLNNGDYIEAFIIANQANPVNITNLILSVTTT